MSLRSKYRTKQREILLQYLKSVSGIHITASDVCEYFRMRGDSIGQSTIYRHLESLVDEGVINKYILDAGSPACFEYVGGECHEESGECYHCKCEGCGRLIHLHSGELEELREYLGKNHRFRLDPMRTVLYGRCEECLQGMGSSGDDTIE